MRITVLLLLIPLSSGLFYGLPQQWDPDEYLFMRTAVRMVNDGTLESGWYGSPASTLFAFLAGIILLIQHIGGLVGWPSHAQSFWTAYHNDITIVYVAGRSIILLAAATNIWLTDRILRRFEIALMARLLAVALLAFTPIYLTYATIIRVDFIQSAANLGTLLFCLNYIQRKSPRLDIAAAGVLLGVAVTSKYLGITAAIPIMVAVAVRARQQKVELITALSHLALAALTSIGAAFFVSPFLFLDFGQVLADVAFEARSSHLGATSNGFPATMSFYLRGLIEQFGWISLTAILGTYVLARNASGWVVISFGLGFLIFISALSLRWERWLITLLPIFAILIAVGANELWFRLANSRWRRSTAIILIGAGLILEIGSGLKVAKARATNNDTRAEAERWMLNHAAVGSSVIIETYAPALSSRDYRVIIAKGGKLKTWTSQSAFDRPLGFFGFGLAGTFSGSAAEFLRASKNEDVDFIILTNWEERYRAEGARSARSAIFYSDLRRDLKPIISFKGGDGTLGPPITIYTFNKY